MSETSTPKTEHQLKTDQILLELRGAVSVVEAISQRLREHLAPVDATPAPPVPTAALLPPSVAPAPEPVDALAAARVPAQPAHPSDKQEVGRVTAGRLRGAASLTEDVRTGDGQLGVIRAIQRLEQKLGGRQAAPGEVLRVVVPRGLYRPFDWNHLSVHDPLACGAKLGAGHLFIDAQGPAVFDHGEPLPGGDSFPIRPTEQGAWLSFHGCRLNSRGRTILLTHPKDKFHAMRLAFGDCTFTSAGAGSPDRNWGMQLYSTTVEMTDVVFDLGEILEHPVYVHGHGGRGAYFVRADWRGCGGNAIQMTQRPSESTRWQEAWLVMKECRMAGFHRRTGRAGSAVTLAGSGLGLKMIDCSVSDLDSTDTVGQQGPDVGTNYGGLVAWLPTVDADSYPDGYGNGDLELEGNVFAIRNGNRPLVDIQAARSVRMANNVFLGRDVEIARGAITSPRRVELAGNQAQDALAKAREFLGWKDAPASRILVGGQAVGPMQYLG